MSRDYTPQIPHILVPIHIDALLLHKPETVLQASTDFSRLPYREAGSRRSVNADVGYSSQEIVTPPFRGNSLRLGAGVHLHWAMPDALTQGVRLGDRLDFPALPDRWLVSRRNRATGETERRWIVESDYLYPEHTLEQDGPPETVTFPLPPLPNSLHGQPFRYLGRNWRADTPKASWPGDLGNADYLNALGDQYADDREKQAAVQVGLTAIGYGDPTFAAFFPNCRSVYGFHDKETTTPDAFAKVSYDLVGWYDQPEERDILRRTVLANTPLELATEAQYLKRRKEALASGHEPDMHNPEQDWLDALAHLLGWAVEMPEGVHQFPANRLFCYGTLRAEADADFVADPAKGRGGTQIAIGNTASEALSATLAQSVPGNPGLIEEQLEALDLGRKFSHYRLDIGPKFKEARHDRGFRAITGGRQFVIRHERAPSESDDKDDTKVNARIEMVLPEFIHHMLNRLNEALRTLEVAEEENASLRAQIYRDWTFYMSAMRPPPGLEGDFPDPVEIMRFTDKTGLAHLRASIAATGPPVSIERGNNNTTAADAPITGAAVAAHTGETAKSAKVADLINDVITGLDLANRLLELLRHFDRIGAAMDTETPEPTGLTVAPPDFPILETTIPAIDGRINSIEFSADGAHLLVAGGQYGCGLFDVTTGKAKHTFPELLSDITGARFNSGSDKIAVTGSMFGGVIDVKNNALSVRLDGHSNTVTQAQFTDDGTGVLTWSYDGSLRVWNAVTGKETTKLETETRWASQMTTHSGQSLIAVGGRTDNAFVTVVESKTYKKVAAFKAGSQNVKKLQFDAEGGRLLVVSTRLSAGIYDPKTGKLLVEFDSKDHQVGEGCLSADGKLVATGARDGTVRIHDLAGDNSVITTVELSGIVFAVAFSPDSTMFLATTYGGVAKIWDARTGKLLHDLTDDDGKIPSVIAFDPTGERVAVGDWTTKKIRIWRIAEPPVEKPSFQDKFGTELDLTPGGDITPVELHREILADVAGCGDLEELQDSFDFLTDMFYDLTEEVAKTPASAASHFTLRQIDAPRFYQPNDPVVLITGDAAKPSSRHGADGAGRDDGKLACQVFETEPLQSLKYWEPGELPATLDAVREFVRALDPGDRESTQGPGLRRWHAQPWHPFAMEWQVEVQPDSVGSNRADNHSTYATDFVEQNYVLPEFGVDLEPRSGSGARPTADSGIYDGSVILVDHASGVMAAKLDALLSSDKADKADKAKDWAKTGQQHANEETLRAVRDRLTQSPATLSQSLDGLHEAFLQRHQILQLPINDPIGPTDFAAFTDTVRRATVGRHGNAPLRDRDFTPIRSGVMHLRQLRLIDTFGRVKTLRNLESQEPLTVAETLSVPGVPSAVALRPRLVQPARINLRWLSARHADGCHSDEPQTNAHPALSPVCGWLLPDVADSTLAVYDSSGTALGLVTIVDRRTMWQPAPGDSDPIDSLDRAHPRINEHLRTLLGTVISEISARDPAFFPAFLDAIGNALETIAPESFSTHRSLALLTGRPVAVVRAMVNLEIKGRPATNESVASVINDMAAAEDPSRRNDPARSRRPRFLVAPVDRVAFESVLDLGDFAALRVVFNGGGIDLPADDNDITLEKISADPDDPRWRIALADRSFYVARDGQGLRVSDDFSRTTDGFCDVRFPIRIGESQQLNDGLIGYFVEEFHANAYRYRDNLFHAPQSAGRVVLEPGVTAPDIQSLIDQLDVGIVPPEVARRLGNGDALAVTVEKTGHRWRIDAPALVYSLVLGASEIELAQIMPSDTAHIRTHWKSPVNIEHAIDAPPLKLTMLVDPQGSVHAVSGIVPTKSITIPTEFYAEALRNIEVILPASPIVTDVEALHMPSWAQEGFELSYLTREGDAWSESAEIKPVDTRAQFSGKQRIVEGWLKLKKAAK